HVLAEDASDRLAQWRLAERVEREPTGAVGAAEAVQQQRAVGAQWLVEHGHAARLARLLERAQPAHQLVQRLVPGDRPERAAAPRARAAQRPVETIRVILLLHASLAAGAELAAVERVVRVAFQLAG